MYAKFQLSSARGTFSNFGLNEGGIKSVHFQRKTGHISKTLRDTVKVTVITNRKWHTPFQMR